MLCVVTAMNERRRFGVEFCIGNCNGRGSALRQEWEESLIATLECGVPTPPGLID